VRKEAYTVFWWGNVRDRDHLRDPGIDGRLMLKMDHQGLGCGGMDWIELAGYGQVAGTRECGNEPSGSIKCGEFLE
jgi:hypothetical protein